MELAELQERRALADGAVRAGRALRDRIIKGGEQTSIVLIEALDGLELIALGYSAEIKATEDAVIEADRVRAEKQAAARAAALAEQRRAATTGTPADAAIGEA